MYKGKICLINTSEDVTGHPIAYSKFLLSLFKKAGYNTYVADFSNITEFKEVFKNENLINVKNFPNYIPYGVG